MLDGNDDEVGPLEASIACEPACTSTRRARTQNLASTTVSLRRYHDAARHLDDVAYTERLDLDAWRLYMLAWRARALKPATGSARATMPRPLSRIPTSRHGACRRSWYWAAARAAWRSDAASPIAEARDLAEPRTRIQRTAPVMDALAEIAHLGRRPREPGRSGSVTRSCRPRNGDPWIRGEIAIWLWRAKALSRCPRVARSRIDSRRQANGEKPQPRGIGSAVRASACVLAWCGGEAAQREALEKFESLGAAPCSAATARGRSRAGGARRVPRGVARLDSPSPFV
jgi:hypothetical protein